MFFGALGWPPAGANILLALLALLVLLAGGRRAPPRGGISNDIPGAGGSFY